MCVCVRACVCVCVRVCERVRVYVYVCVRECVCVSMVSFATLPAPTLVGEKSGSTGASPASLGAFQARSSFKGLMAVCSFHPSLPLPTFFTVFFPCPPSSSSPSRCLTESNGRTLLPLTKLRSGHRGTIAVAPAASALSVLLGDVIERPCVLGCSKEPDSVGRVFGRPCKLLCAL
jgi:hypothetical protein